MAKDKDGKDVYEETYRELTEFEHFFINNWKTVVTFSMLLVLAVAVFMIFARFSDNQSRKIANAIAAADTPEKLKEMIKKHGDHPNCDFARLRLAEMLVKDKNYEEAMKIYQALCSSRHAEVAERAKLNVGYVLELAGKKEEACAKFEQAGNDPLLSQPTITEANYNAARIYDSLGQKDKAKACLAKIKLPAGPESMTPGAPGSFWATKIERLKDSLE